MKITDFMGLSKYLEFCSGYHKAIALINAKIISGKKPTQRMSHHGNKITLQQAFSKKSYILDPLLNSVRSSLRFTLCYDDP